jgi:hypothetical protein
MAIFVPFSDKLLAELGDLSADNIEVALFEHTLNEEGYQSEVSYLWAFDEFKEKSHLKKESNYTYRTN